MFQKCKRITALVLVIAMLFTSVPLNAFAQESPLEPGRFRDVP